MERSRELLRANDRAYRLRKRLKAGRVLSDIETAWLAKHAAHAIEVRKRRPRRAPSVPLAQVLDRVVMRSGVSREVIRSSRRGGFDTETVRAVAVVAMRMTGAPFYQIAAELNRTANTVFALYGRAHRRHYVRREAERVLQVSPPDGTVVMFEVTVGSALWRMLDKLDELHGLSEAAVTKRVNADAKAQRRRAE